MSNSTPTRAASPRLTAPDIAARKGSDPPLVMVTAYDAPSARTVDAAGADLILVGDTLAMVVLGYDDTLQVTTADMAHHVGAVARTRPQALVVGDLPWLSYHVTPAETVCNAATLIRAGAGAVKLEGGRKRLDAIWCVPDNVRFERLVAASAVSHIAQAEQSRLAIQEADGRAVDMTPRETPPAIGRVDGIELWTSVDYFSARIKHGVKKQNGRGWASKSAQARHKGIRVISATVLFL
jgi:hypothetical protein